MSTLTEEQKRRVEENKRKALAIRAAKTTGASASLANITAPCPAPVPKFPNNSAFDATKPAWSNFKQGNQGFSNNGLKNRALAIQKKKTAENHNNPSKVAPISNFYGSPAAKPVTVNCSLISRDRFTVEFAYNKHIVELFKTIPNKLYGWCSFETSTIIPRYSFIIIFILL